MDILYIVGTGSKWNNNELRYSLRSIAKYGKNIGRVYLCGYKPDWVSREVTHIAAKDIYNRKHKNILHKVRCAMDFSDIGRHFLISSDDHYYIRETDFEELPLYYRAEEIPDKMPKNNNNEYFRSLIQTRQLLERHGLPIFQTNPHCNTHFDADIYEAYQSLFNDCFKLLYGGEMNCVMGNLLIKEGWEAKPFHDSKLSGKYNTEELFRERIGDAECLSSTSAIRDTYIQKWLIEHFPDKCKYEL